jgi:hypothetical protein
MAATGRRTPTVLFVDRSNGSQFRSGKKHRADHSVLPDSPTVWARLKAAAAEASCNDRGTLLPQHCLWRHVDPQIETKSVAVKATVQALCLRKLEFPDPTLARWMELARVVAEGAHALYAHAVLEWNVGLDVACAVVKGDYGDTAPFEAWNPFELYDRTADARFEGCFGETEAHRMRSRVMVREGARVKWEAAVDAHWNMLALEGRHELFAPSSTLSAEQIGGLYALTHTADNWPKLAHIFDNDYWLLRIVHLGLERNTPLQMAKFDLGALSRAQPPVLARDSKKVCCWLVNSLVALVALKVVIFYKIRVHAYDEAAGRALTTDAELARRVRADRHDLEQSKLHWRPAPPPASPSTSFSSSSPSLSPSLSPPRTPPPSSQNKKRPRDEEEKEEEARGWEVGHLAPARQILERLVVERRALQARVALLDEAVATHLAFAREVATQTEALQATALAHLDRLSAIAAGAPDADTRAAAQAEMQQLSARFTATNGHKRAVEAVRAEAAATGLLLCVEDRVWALDHHPSVCALVAVGAGGYATSVRRHVRQAAEFDRLFGPDGARGELGTGAASVARCGLHGSLRAEALSLVDRMLNMARAESELREAALLDARVPIPLELTAPLALAGALGTGLPAKAPAYVKAYATAKRAHEEQRKRATTQFLEGTKRAMGHAIARGLNACWAVLRAEQQDAADSFHMKQQPLRLQCATDAVHALLGIAHAFGGLSVDGGDDEVGGVAPIVVWSRELGRPLVPFPERVVTEHWAAAQHLLAVVARVEPWVLKPRRAHVRELAPDSAWVECGPRGPVVRQQRREAFMAWLDARAAHLGVDFWPEWPPKPPQLVAPARLATALRYCKHKHACAFLSLEPAAVPPCAQKPPFV